jgi:hypothetical protein
MTLSALGIFSAAGAGGEVAGSSFDLISTTILGSATASVTFDVTSLASTYKHLQVRVVMASDITDGIYSAMRLNADTGSNYSVHALYGTNNNVGSLGAANTTSMSSSSYTSSSNSLRAEASVIDLLDAFSTSKNKTLRMLTGIAETSASTSSIALFSGNWRNTAAITSVQLLAFSQGVAHTFIAGSRFSLYGIKG